MTSRIKSPIVSMCVPSGRKTPGVYSVKAAAQRANFLDKAEPGWISILKLHYGAFATLEGHGLQCGVGVWRVLARPAVCAIWQLLVLWTRIANGQIQLYFPHEHVQRSRQFDWATKSMHTNEWAVVAARHLF